MQEYATPHYYYDWGIQRFFHQKDEKTLIDISDNKHLCNMINDFLILKRQYRAEVEKYSAKVKE